MKPIGMDSLDIVEMMMAFEEVFGAAKARRPETTI